MSSARRKVLLLVASLYFYARFDWRFPALLCFSVAANYAAAWMIATAPSEPRRRLALGLSVAFNLALLGYFKYQGFFADAIQNLLAAARLDVQLRTVETVVPVGLSFYTFRALGYVVDVYRGDLAPCRRFLDWATCLTFFPYLVAGPVARPKEFLTQLDEPRRPPALEADLAFTLIVLGLFKKIVVANSLQQGLVEPVLSDPFSHSRGLVLAATYGYAIQLYSDFSAYSDLAIGVALLLGFRTPANFASPYRAQSLQEFWRRWHITLSTWLRDYLYIPLGGSRKGAGRTAINLMATMVLGGLWHGARGNFVVWGAWHGLGLVIERQFLLPRRRSEPARAVAQVCRTVGTFHFVCLGWVFFRAESLADAGDHLRAIVQPRLHELGHFAPPALLWLLLVAGFVTQFLPPDLHATVRERVKRWPLALQGLLLGVLLALLRAAWPDGVAPFIYAGF